jgi:hypothetical protein
MDCFASLAMTVRLWARSSEKQPDGQITQNLSSPFAKNIPLAASAKSVASLRPSHPNEGRLAIVTKRAVGCGGREGCD